MTIDTVTSEKWKVGIEVPATMGRYNNEITAASCRHTRTTTSHDYEGRELYE
jgi:hypothetical protein